MQWNVEKGLGRQSTITNAAAKAIARIVNYNQPDILLFNEVDASGLSAAQNEAAIVEWITNNVSYLGAQSGVDFFVKASSISDGFNRNAAVSRYPISNATTYDDSLRGLHSFRVQLTSTNLQVFHAHLKCCSDGSSCTTKQTEAQFDSDTIKTFAATNSSPYIFAGDWNEDEQNPECTLSATYHPITTIITNGGFAEFKPTMLNGEYRTWSTAPTTPSIRFDYVLSATNRLTPASGYVFSTTNWAMNGLYTNASPQNLVNDSRTASDHYCVFANFSFATNGSANMAVTPAGGFSSSGFQGGPFAPTNQTYTVNNAGSVSLNWSATKSSNWLTLSVSGGTLAAGAGTNVVVTINSNANALATNTYSDTISFTNTTSGSGSTTRSVSLSVLDTNTYPSGFFDDFSTFAPGNLVGQSNWVQRVTVSTLPLQVGGGKVAIPFGQSVDNQDAYKNFSATNGTVFYGLTLTITNAPTNNTPSYFTALYTSNNATGFANYRLSAKDNGSGTCVLAARITGETGDPFTFGTTGLNYGTQYRVIVEADSGGTVLKVFVDPTSTNLAAQTLNVSNYIGTGTAPTQVGSFVISQFVNGTTPNVGARIGKVVVSDSFATVYNDITDPVAPPVAAFNASPTNGAAPLTVTFTDTSTGSITNRFWNFGDGSTTNITATNIAHTYAAGNYDVTLTVSGVGGANTNIQLNYISASPLSAFELWQIQYFGGTNNPSAAAGADPDGDGQNNIGEFTANTVPTNSASVFRIAAVVREGNNLRIAWTMGSGKTNALQISSGNVTGNYSEIFTVATASSSTNYLDTGAATNPVARYYRVLLVP